MRVAESVIVLLLAATQILTAPPASAHPPYERVARVLGSPSVGEATLVKSYIDGIVFADPVKLVVRDRSGATVAETEYARDLAIICWSSSACAVFQYDGFFPLAPIKVWRLNTSTLLPDDSTWLWLIGIVAPYFEHWLAYLIAVGCVLVPAAALKSLVRRPAGAVRSGMLLVVGVASAFGLFAWLYLVVALSGLSLPLVAALIVAVLVLSVLLRRRAKEPMEGAAPRVAG